ncbi:MAG: PepSY domain-containing protein [Actinobacteria bacterium]|nr:PepSY domain-containing protein [Actinomycetota bacterium]
MNDEMNNSLSVSTEGEVLKCAKGADVSACGFTPGAKVCGKCGAMPVQMKMVPVDDAEDTEEEEMDDEERATPAPRPADPVAMEDAGMEPEQLEAPEEDEEEDDLTEEEKGLLRMLLKKRKGRKYKGMDVMPDEDMLEDDESLDEEEKAFLAQVNKKRKARGLAATANGFKGMNMEAEEEEVDMADEEDMTEEEKELLATINKKRKARGLAATTHGFKEKEMMDDEMSEDMPDDEEAEKQMMLEKMRKKRIQSMGMKSEDFGTRGYLCAIERKAYPGGSSVCDDCPGGCIAEKGLPGLLHVEGIAEQMFDGKVLDSGYSAKADMYVIDVQTKSGSVNEVFIDGTTAEVQGFHKLDNSVFEQKSAQGGLEMIQFHEAAEIAVKSIDGHVIGVEPDSFEGIDSYAVEIDGFDGKSYDVFVSLDGEVLGYDKYEMDEAEEIEAEAAEIALKRAFTDDQRNSMSKEGTAMADGSFPIKSESDLRNAIQAYGRAKDKEAAKRHIMKRAKDMGKESLIPSNWVMGGGTEKKSDTVDAGLMASLIEFELLQAETEIN